jgi:hypothetical protein
LGALYKRAVLPALNGKKLLRKQRRRRIFVAVAKHVFERPKSHIVMKNRNLKLLIALTLLTGLRQASAQGTAFTYQGQFNVNGAPADGSYDLTFTLYTNSSGGTATTGTITNLAASVSNGLFTTTIDFGADVFTGATNWLQIGVRINGGGAFTALTPRQQIMPTPYAIYAPNAGLASTAASANSVAAVNVSGTLGLGQLPGGLLTNGETGATLGGTFTGNGGGLTNLNAARLSSGVVPTAVLPGFQSSSNYATVGGGFGNNASAELATIGGGQNNTNSSQAGTISGGQYNIASGAYQATVGGGYNNKATNSYATVPGGGNNTAGGVCSFAAGAYAQATNSGSFVWSDYSSTNYFASTTNNQFNVRANGGVVVITSGAGLTLDGQPVLTVGSGALGLTIQQNAGAAPNIIAGYSNNFVSAGVTTATISGGGENGGTNRVTAFGGTVGGGYGNAVSNFAGTVSGGANNTAAGNASSVGGGSQNTASGDHATIGGGQGNISSGPDATVGGGQDNTASLDNYGYTTVSGGESNNASGDWATVGGGLDNVASGLYATIGGGYNNLASGAAAVIGGGGYINGALFAGNYAGGAASTVGGGLGNWATNSYATVPGGLNNVAGGVCSFAAGYLAHAQHQGAFVWADTQDGWFSSTSTNQFSVRANGGVVFATSGAGMTVDGAPVLTSGSGSGLTIQQNSAGAPNLIGGSPVNFVAGGVVGATIGGGGATDLSGVSNTNSVSADFGTVGGGYDNTVTAVRATVAGGSGNIAAGAEATVGGGLDNIASGIVATIAGGEDNIADGDWTAIGGGLYDTNSATAAGIGAGEYNLIDSGASFSFIGAGVANMINSGGEYSFIGAGAANTINGEGEYSFIGGGLSNTNSGIVATIAGGQNNTVTATGGAAAIAGGQDNMAGVDWATIGGGVFNTNNGNAGTISGGRNNTVGVSYEAAVGGGISNQVIANYATVPGGANNIASGVCSFAAGENAQATDDNSFVWGDGTRTAISQGVNSFAALATGGVYFYTIKSPGAGGPYGAELAAGATSWSVISDRNAKKNFQPVDTAAVLEKLAAMPIEQWNYIWEQDSDVPHIGPMAQDFKHAFYPGRDDKGITTLEFDGVELAAIQGLNQKVKELKSENASLHEQNAVLEKRLQALEHIVQTLADR